MSIYAALALGDAVIALLLSSFVFYRSPRVGLTRVAVFMGLLTASWSFAKFEWRQAETFESAQFWIRAGAGWPMAVAAAMHLALLFTGQTRVLRSKVTYVLLYGPAAVLSLLVATSDLVTGPPVRVFWGWKYSVGEGQILFPYSIAWLSILSIGSIALCVRYYLGLTEHNAKQRTKYVLIGYSVPTIIIVATQGVLPVFNIQIPEAGSLALTVFIVYGIWRYSLFPLTAAVAAERIVASMSNFLILTDSAGMITSTNRSTEALLGYQTDELLGQPVTGVFSKERAVDELEQSVGSLSGSSTDSLNNVESSFQKKDGATIPVLLSVAPVHGRVGEAIGTVFVGSDLSERKRAEAALIAARDQAEQAQEDAEEANQAKSQFLSSMSHELRTPLTAILGFGEILEGNPQDPLSPGQQEGVEYIVKAGEHLRTLIDDVLDLARIESGRLSLSPEPVLVGPVLVETLAIVEPLAATRRITLQDQTSAVHRQAVLADRNRLKQVLLNLLTNAIKYNREAGTVTLTAELAPERRLHLTVADTGSGLTEEQQALLFEPFERLGAEQSGVEGTGIGLTITKRLMDLMGGRIVVESVEGEGSRFTLDLPLTVAPRGQPPDARRGPGAVGAEAGDPRRTVLYVEDNPAMQALVERILARRPQVRLLTAPQAQMGLELARAHRPDLIVLDINLPGMDGYEALAWLQRYEETRAIPVLALSANAMASDVKRGKAAGFLEYLTKPVDVAAFLAAIDRGLARQPQAASAAEATPAVDR